MLLSIMIPIFIFAIALDFHSTKKALATGKAKEKNPITALCIKWFGIRWGLYFGAVVLDLILMWLVLCGYYYFGWFPIMYAYVFLGLGALGQFIVAIRNYKLAARLSGKG